MPPKISVIIPVYNCEDYIERCIESICLQDLEDVEIIIINDGSTDSSQAIIDSLTNQYKNIISIRTKNYGVSNARNVGIEKSKGEYLFFVDADDYLQINSLENMYKLAKESNASLVFGGLDIYNKNVLKEVPNINKKRLKEQEVICEILTNNIPRTACGILFKGDIIRKNLLRFKKELVYGEDFLFTLFFISYSDVILVLDSLFYIVEKRANSASRLHDLEHIKKVISLEKELEAYIGTYNNKPQLINAFRYFIKSEIVLSIEKIIMSNTNINNKIKHIRLVKTSNTYNKYFKRSSGRSVKTKFDLKEKLIRIFPITIILFIYYLKKVINNMIK